MAGSTPGFATSTARNRARDAHDVSMGRFRRRLQRMASARTRRREVADTVERRLAEAKSRACARTRFGDRGGRARSLSPVEDLAD